MSHNGHDAAPERDEARVVVEAPLPSYEEAIASGSAIVGFKPYVPVFRPTSPVQNERTERPRAVPRGRALSDETRRNSIRRTMVTILSGLIFIVFCLILLLRFQRQSCRCPRTYSKHEIDDTETDSMYVSYTRCNNEKNKLQRQLNALPNFNDLMKQTERLIRENEAFKLSLAKAQTSSPQPNESNNHDIQQEIENINSKFKFYPGHLNEMEEFKKFFRISINNTDTLGSSTK